MLEEEYQPRRVIPRQLRSPEVPEKAFEYSLREAVAADLPAVREIYNYYVTNSTVTFDEETMTLRQWREKLDYLRKQNMQFIVAEAPSGQLLGYALVAPWKQKRAYRFTVESSIYLGPAATGKGLGRVLLAELLIRAKDTGIREVIAVIADQGAEGSLRLHESFGFTEVGRMGRVGFKFERWLGVIMLQKTLR